MAQWTPSTVLEARLQTARATRRLCLAAGLALWALGLGILAFPAFRDWVSSVFKFVQDPPFWAAVLLLGAFALWTWAAWLNRKTNRLREEIAWARDREH